MAHLATLALLASLHSSWWVMEVSGPRTDKAVKEWFTPIAPEVQPCFEHEDAGMSFIVSFTINKDGGLGKPSLLAGYDRMGAARATVTKCVAKALAAHTADTAKTSSRVKLMFGPRR